MRPAASQARRIVVKIGSSVLTRDGELESRVFGDISRQVAELFDAGREVVIVSSGAIAIGARELGWSEGGRSIREKQAAAAVGQIGLIEQYRRRFVRRGRKVAQVLVTRSGLADHERFINARHTLLELLRIGVVPIVNENDTVATEEIRFGDNDNLSATVANLIGADLLVILTDVEGLYQTPPRDAAKPKLFDVVERVTPEIERAAGGSTSAFGRGGMTTKLEAAQAAARCGATTVLCNGRRRDVLLRVAAGDPVGTIFTTGNRLASRKHWLAFTTRTHGELVLDDGAVRAIEHGGKSLLPAGIVEVRGKFRVGDPVVCVDSSGRSIARGLAAYAFDAVERIARRSTREIVQMLGYSNGDEVIHRDDLVLLEDPSE
ncbi:MAG: glutamate 5-kinase [Deltaproteobacteria bacterium]|nr:glutamate 5-kinase [Deltaproteobacteria bacterium]